MTDLTNQIENGGLTTCGNIEPLLTKVILDIYHLFKNIVFHLKLFNRIITNFCREKIKKIKFTKFSQKYSEFFSTLRYQNRYSYHKKSVLLSWKIKIFEIFIGHFLSVRRMGIPCDQNLDFLRFRVRINIGDIDVGDGFWSQIVLVTSLRCWWPI